MYKINEYKRGQAFMTRGAKNLICVSVKIKYFLWEEGNTNEIKKSSM